ncbi:class I SAM-dependent methyltransferase [Rhizobium terrae]|uniref:class I SAM-dependent methyltransferase n=1 Tax=Rhizobium terrae TaxID=2171756 RepID=UPI000E3C8F7E|nr:class I SAM-dependent methyltransferase [Rhizobium terrae]
MSGFDRDWLALREPVDARSRDTALLQAACETARDTILDIGCGTGSTFRMLSPRLAAHVRWRFIDNDPNLLEEARRRHGDVAEIVHADLKRIDAPSFADVGLVTASALFDLCSEDFIRAFVERVSETGAAFYAALSYDGSMSWSRPHPLDEVMTANFNAHQLSDKGFGISLGPKAWQVLADRLKTHSYQIRVAESPWRMTPADADLQRLFLNGIVRAVFEYGELDEAEIRDWAEFRHRMIEREDSLCRVGHQDVLAIR